MPSQIDKINKIEKNIIIMERELERYQAAFLKNDGKIDDKEQAQLDTMFSDINNVVDELFRRKAALPPEITRKDFSAGTYKQANYAPPTGRGLFDVNLNPNNGRLEILTKIKFDFINGSVTDFAKRVGEGRLWATSEKEKWKASYIALIEGRWGGKYQFVHPDMETLRIYVDVEVEEATSGWHYEANITKIPKGEWASSSVGRNNRVPESLQTTFDSEDLEWVDKGVSDKQKGAVHEYGHMIGLDDEYPVDGAIAHATMVRDALGTILVEGKFNDVMSSGDHIEKQHYITFLQALKDITNLKKWQFKK